MMDTGLVLVTAVHEAMEHDGATYPKPEAGHNHEDHEVRGSMYSWLMGGTPVMVLAG